MQIVSKRLKEGVFNMKYWYHLSERKIEKLVYKHLNTENPEVIVQSSLFYMIEKGEIYNMMSTISTLYLARLEMLI